MRFGNPNVQSVQFPHLVPEGRAEGIKESMETVAGKMRKMGESIEKIHVITGLPLETIERM